MIGTAARMIARDRDADMSTTRPLVAVVDDDPGMLRSVARWLTASGYDVQAFGSGEAFLSDPAAQHVICLILDIHLGGMSGLDLRRRLTASGSSIPVIFMTAIDDEVTHREALDTGCIAFLRKPF